MQLNEKPTTLPIFIPIGVVKNIKKPINGKMKAVISMFK
jgi:hypothetical protein